MPNLGGWELVVLLGVLVLVFGAKRLPDMARSVGQSARVFKGEMKGMKKKDDPQPEVPADADPASPVARPVDALPVAVPAAQPAVSQPSASQPAASQPAASQPAASQPAASQPAASQPAGQRPAPIPPAAVGDR